MPRPLYMTEPKVINVVRSRGNAHPYLEVATTNRDKLEEFRRILPDYEIVGKNSRSKRSRASIPIK